MIEYLTKEAKLEAIKADIMRSLSQRSFEADALLGHLPFKDYHVEIALHDMIEAGQVVSYWTDSGAFQRKFYALAEKFDHSQLVVQFCASAKVVETLSPINLTTRAAIRRAQAKSD